MREKDPDPLCRMVVDHFVYIYGTEAGNQAVKLLPSGGLYLVGGLTNALKDYLIKEKTFMEAFYDKGRCAETLKDISVFVVRADAEVGLLGAEEMGRRAMMDHIVKE